MWVAVGFLLFLSDVTSGKLVGDHICQEEYRYTVNITEYFIRNSTVRRYQWCLHYPPRCSFYTTRLVNDSRVVEKEIADLVDKCCSGYEEDVTTNTCTPICPDCFNGTCLRGKCDCFPGFKGDYCDKECEPDKWGPNCSSQCTCHRGSCDPKTGHCDCPPGWTGPQCSSACSPGSFGKNCAQKCSNSCNNCDPVSGDCQESSTDAQATTSKILFRNNGRFETEGGLIVTSSFLPEVTETGRQFTTNFGNEEDEGFITPFEMMKSRKAKVNRQDFAVSDADRPHEENLLADDDDDEEGRDVEQPPVDRSDLVSGASAATAISVAVIVVAVLVVGANCFIIRKKKRKKEEREKSKGNGVSTVSVYTHSIFHTPLPEPPTFENPVENNQTSDGQIFEARVVCSMNFPTHPTKDPREYLYDHPPSTGSYRAASIPEPPDSEMASLQSLPHTEPVYDEIPTGMAPTPVSEPPPSYKSCSLYMNTCGKTRL